MHDPDIAEQRALQAARDKEPEAPDQRERRAEILLGGLTAAAMAALWLFPVDRQGSVVAALACIAAMVLTTLVRFDVGFGFTVPLQLAFVPLLFAVPAPLVPIATVAAVMAARLPDVVAGRTAPQRLVLSIRNSAFAIGPAAVLVAAGGAGAVVDHPALALAVFAAQFAGDFLASAVRELLMRETTLKEQIADATRVYAVDAALTPVPLWLIVEGARPETAVAVTLTFVGLIARFAHERGKRLDSMFELNNAYHGTALLLGDVVEADDTYTGEHSRGVVALALDVGHQLGLDPIRVRNLEFAALLHDVGKVAIPKAIINKPGKLDPREWEVIKTHTTEGQRMLDRIGGFMGEVGRIVRSHHERWDGGGYPDGLAGDRIPLEARIVTACDSYNAMTTTRPYRDALPVSVAVAELQAHAGTQFDPAVVGALIAVVARTEDIAGDVAPRRAA